MKYANKLMVVPYVPRLENASESQIFSLDNEMAQILNDKNKQVDEKVKLYNHILSKYMSSLENYNMSNVNRQEDNTASFSSLIADKTYSKIKTEMDSFKSNDHGEQKLQIKPQKLVSNVKKLEPKENKVLQKQDPPTISKIAKFIEPNKVETKPESMVEEANQETIMNETTTIMPELETSVLPLESTSPETSQNVATKMERGKFEVVKTVSFAGDEKVYEVRKNNNSSYLVPRTITENAYSKLLRDLPDGVDIDNLINYIKQDGLKNMKHSIDKHKDTTNIYNKMLNEWFVKANTSYQNQKGSALITNKWIFKKYF